MDYVALFPAGAEKLVTEGLKGMLPAVRILESDESALVFSTPARLRSADEVPFVKNIFAVNGRAARRGLDASVADLARKASSLQRPPGAAAFRVMCHLDGQLVAFLPRVRTQLENSIRSATGLRAEPRGHCQEYWVIGRKDWPTVYLGERLSKARRPAHRGSLSDELSTLLVSLSRPGPEDVFLDPFAGSGSIVAARLASPARQVIYNDTDRSLRSAATARLGRRPPLAYRHEDATDLASVGPAQVSVIVTDPPWGEYEEPGDDYPAFMQAMAREFARILDPRTGRLVILIARRLEQQLRQSLTEQGLACDPPVEILVNGHPASVIRACLRPR